MRYDSKELSLIKNTFAENDNVLYAIRKVMYQMPLSERDEIELLPFKNNKPLIKIMRKFFLPELEGELPIGQNIDLWMTVKIDDKTPEDAKPHIQARGKLIEYIDQQLGVLDNDIKPHIKFTELSNGEYVDMVVRNTLVGHTEQQLMQISILAGTKEESPEETIKRLQADSSK